MDAKIILLALYALMIVSIGIYGMKRTKNSKDFLLGGGTVGPWLSAFSYATAYFSAVAFIGYAGKIGWGFGYSGMWIGLFNASIGVLAVWIFLGWRIKKTSKELKAQTMSEYLEKRYDSPFMKLFSSIAIFIFLVPYSAAVFIGLSYLFTVSFPGISYTSVVLFMALFTAMYVSMGGYKSMALVDSIFGIIMIGGVIMMAYFTIGSAGGIGAITQGLSSINPKLAAPVGPPGIWPLFSLIFLTSVAPFAMPQLVQKFYAIKDKRSIKIGAVVSTLFSLLIGIVAYFMGSTTRLFLTPESTPAVFTPSGIPIFDALMPELFNLIIPEALLIIVLILLLSASMSTLASLILISSSSLSIDFYAGFINKEITDRKITRFMRIGSILFVAISAGIALLKPDTIVTIMGISWGAIGSMFLGPFIWGLFSKRSNKTGALAGMMSGLIVCLALFFFGSMTSPEAGTVGMVISLAVTPLVSRLYTRSLSEAPMNVL